MRNFLIIAVLIIQWAVTAQNKFDLIVNESLEYEDKVKADSIQSIYTSELGNTVIIRNFKRDIFFDIFDRSLSKKFSKVVELDRNENYLGDIFYNDEIKIFTETLSKSNKKVLACHILNLTTKATKKIELSITEIDKRLNLYSNKKGAVFALSPNSNFFTLTTFIIHKGEIYFQANVFNAKTFELIYEKQSKRIENQFYSISDIYIDNQKNVFVFGESFYDENNTKVKNIKKHYFLLEKFSASSYSKLKIDFGDTYVKSMNSVVFNDQFNFYCLYSVRDFKGLKGVCNVSINLDLLEISNKNFQDFPEDIYTNMFGTEKIEKKKRNV